MGRRRRHDPRGGSCVDARSEPAVRRARHLPRRLRRRARGRARRGSAARRRGAVVCRHRLHRHTERRRLDRQRGLAAALHQRAPRRGRQRRPGGRRTRADGSRTGRLPRRVARQRARHPARPRPDRRPPGRPAARRRPSCSSSSGPAGASVDPCSSRSRWPWRAPSSSPPSDASSTVATAPTRPPRRCGPRPGAASRHDWASRRRRRPKCWRRRCTAAPASTLPRVHAALARGRSAPTPISSPSPVELDTIRRTILGGPT